uniref:Mos1 transposase HTH domain-containing protein n=1 Tax=Anabas testudineus TaxID=64144 RepID=A0A7N6BDS1_ANATE
VGSRIEQWSVIKFLVAAGCKPAEIHRRMSTVYGATCFSQKNVYKRAKLFKEGRSSVEDEGRPGRPTEVRSREVIESVNDLIQSHRRVTVDDIARSLKRKVILKVNRPQDFGPRRTHLLQFSEAGGKAAGIGSAEGAAGSESGRRVVAVGTQRDRPR